ncbi:MAG TPA: hypothetical protein IAB56_01690 [Candidatus Scybalousia intestinigallinarum]|nr:hypothetical protein [Candidatus Scybalousia intestinigallinarum]
MILITIENSQGNNFVAPIEIETITNANNIKLDINRVKSVYGKENLNQPYKKDINQKEFQKMYKKRTRYGQ